MATEGACSGEPFLHHLGLRRVLDYQVAIRSDSRWLSVGFYSMFVWALGCAVAVGFWTIPHWGWLPIVALAPATVVLVYDFLTGAG